MWSVAVVMDVVVVVKARIYLDTDRVRACADADRDAVGDVGGDAVGDVVGGVVSVM